MRIKITIPTPSLTKLAVKIPTVMYMAMMSTMQCNPVFKVTYQRLLAVGKPKKTAIIAYVRRIIIILNSMIIDGAM